MNISCIPEFNYFDTPEFLATVLHITTILSTPIYIFGIYIVITRTPEAMKGVKWYLVNVHVWIILFDYSVGFLTMPFLLLPAWTGFPLGYLKYLGVSTINQTNVVILVFGFMVASLIMIFENRFHKVCTYRFKYLWDKWRWKWMAAHYLLPFVLIIPFFLLVPEQEAAVKRVFHSLPCLPPHIYQAPVFVLTENYGYHLTVIIIYLVICGFEAIPIVLYSAYNTIQQLKARTMSQKAFQMQKSFFLALLIQLAIPLIMLIVCIVSWLVLILVDFYVQWITNIDIITITMHGSVSTVSMLIAHKPYREAIVQLVRKRTVVSVEHSNKIYLHRNIISDVQN